MKDFSEQDICSKYILPSVIASGWDLERQIREQYSFTAGQITVRGKTVIRGEKTCRFHFVSSGPSALGDY